MKDFKHYKIFPTHVFSFKGQGVNDKEMLEYFENEIKKTSGNKSLNWQSSPELHENTIFKSLVNNIMEATKLACDAIKLDTSYKLEITNMWGNVLQQNECHPPHTHSNNFLSGVFYIDADNTSGITFQDPRPGANVILPRKKFDHMNNASLLHYKSKTNRIMMFPSWLVHWVPINLSTNNRISISWNIQIRGQLGEHHEFQSANI